MKNHFVILFVFISNLIVAQIPNQYESIDRKIDEMPNNLESSTAQIIDYINANFSSLDDKIRAAFYWTASSIDYDIENMFNQKLNQTPQQKIELVMQTKKGVCMHYAEVFNDLMNKLNVNTIIVEGYTKQDGKVTQLGHVWCASKINNKWFLFDPTWASGHVTNGKYIKKLNNNYYKAEASTFIINHIPFDYLWQFSEFPITNKEFYDGRLVSENTSQRFDFFKEVEKHLNLSELDKAIASANRIEKNGLLNELILERYNFEKTKIENFKLKNSFDKVTQIVANANEATVLYNEFIKYKNNKFTPIVSDEALKNKIQVPYNMLLNAISDLDKLKDIKRDKIGEINAVRSSMVNSIKLHEEQLKFVNQYLALDTLSRQKMFYKTTVVRKKTK